MTTDDENPYQVFVDVLSYRLTGTHQLALTGEMIAAYAEMNHILGRTKGKLDRDVWAECGDELIRWGNHYESAWTGFREASSHDPESQSRPGPDVTRGFQDAVDGLRAVLEVLRREFELMGKDSWKY
jgi:hypothetical protein